MATAAAFRCEIDESAGLAGDGLSAEITSRALDAPLRASSSATQPALEITVYDLDGFEIETEIVEDEADAQRATRALLERTLAAGYTLQELTIVFGPKHRLVFGRDATTTRAT